MLSFRTFTLVTLSLTIFSIFVQAQKTPKIDFAKKIEESTPSALPQSPVAQKLKSDAQDNNLKGKVKSVIEDVQYTGKRSRERNSEVYYNESGNYLKSVSYTDGYPDSVIVWGYIDGKRVSKSNDINYAKGERPPSEGITMRAEDNLKNPNAPKDTRYSIRYEYRYNENGQLVETWIYLNNGELWSRDVNNYKGNQREELNYGQDGSEWSQTVKILDKDGNEIEENLMDEHGKVGDKTTYTYEYDAKGNWIVQKAFENQKVKGKWIPKLWHITYRTITYYP
jgi:hypothetical protein